MEVKNKIVAILDEQETWYKDVLGLIKAEEIDLPKYEELEEWQTNTYEENGCCKNIQLLLKDICIRAYHGCRVFDLNDYYKNGLKIPSKKMYIELFNKYCRYLDFELSESQYERAIKYINESNLEREIFFNLSKKELLTYSSHYITYGSEKIQAAFANALFTSPQFLFLNNITTIPTIFEIDVPINFLDEDQKRFACAEILMSLCDYIDGFDYDADRDRALVLRRNLPAKYISSHIHPKQNSIKY